MEKLGLDVWWKYVVLFWRNQCNTKKYIDHCVRKTLFELEASNSVIKEIENKLKEVDKSLNE